MHAIIEEWEHIPQETIDSLIASIMARRSRERFTTYYRHTGSTNSVAFNFFFLNFK